MGKLLMRAGGFFLLMHAAYAADSQVEWMAAYTGESAHVLSGGVEKGSAYLGNLDLTAQWNVAGDLTVFAYVLGNHGDDPGHNIGDKLGDAQGYSNIAAPQTIKLYELWLEKTFADGEHSVKFGLIDLNSEFDVIDSAGVFQNSSFGIGPDFSQSGENGPSIFPTTSIGVRWASVITHNVYTQCIVLDGVAGDPENEKGTQIKLDSGDGWLTTCEAGWRADAEEKPVGVSKMGLGVWRYSEKTDRWDGEQENNNGVYLIGEHTFWNEGDRFLSAFARLGFADERINQFARYQGAGVSLNGVWFDDASDQLGLAVASVENSGDFLDSVDGAGLGKRETVIELAYRFTITDWLTLQPSLQQIVNPGMNPALDDALAFSLRFELGQSGAW